MTSTTTTSPILKTVAYAVLLLGHAAVAPAQTGPASAGPADPALIQDLIAANRILAAQGIVDAFGHVSVRHDKDPNRFLMSRSLAPELVTADDLIEYDLDANAVDLSGRSQYSERYIHAEIYKARPDVMAVVHNHSPSVIPFGISSVPLKPVYHMAGFIGEGLPIYDIREAAGMTEMLVNNAARGSALARELGDRPAVLMRGHGVAVVGPALPFAVGRSVYLELNASIQLQAIGLGGSVTYLDPQEARLVVEAGENRSYDRPWEVWRRHALGE
ncbi:MAG TPA: class II aldolase/adducin family protein [Gammaproteobacteria bacterium]|jgi:HCOMODA/2-hydroxy-3-carboxy-muconic semialdehyde decarboxylase